jgi:hypothetical protein
MTKVILEAPCSASLNNFFPSSVKNMETFYDKETLYDENINLKKYILNLKKNISSLKIINNKLEVDHT